MENSNSKRWITNVPTDWGVICRLSKLADRAGFERWRTEYVYHTDMHYIVIEVREGPPVRVPYPELDNYLTALELVHGDTP